ncbi:MAG: transcriptional regulator [Gammaproteobacteria bacterium]|nr:transcriptional regulator [Gammaproteobacteria bacterium]
MRANTLSTIRSILLFGETARALDVIGDRWSLLILRDAFLGVRRFEEFCRRTGAARGTLAARLNDLVASGVIYKSVYGASRKRLEYRLTEKGLAIYPVALGMWRWENRWSTEFGLPPRIVHRTCRHSVEPVLACGECNESITLDEISYKAGSATKHTFPHRSGVRRRKAASIGHVGTGIDTALFHTVDTVGDRWTALLIAALFFGLHRYDDISRALGIATNVLADRLRKLLSTGVIKQQLYALKPPRYEYKLTDKGRDLFPFTFALHEWGGRWFPSAFGPSIIFRHRVCDKKLRSRLTCGACGMELDPHDVDIRVDSQPRRSSRHARGGKGKKPLVRRM